MKRTALALLLILAALFVAGWTWDDSAHAAPRVCHGHNSACAAESTATAPSASIVVTDSSTTVRATGCQATERTQIHVDYLDSSGEDLLSVDGYTTSGADGSVNVTFGIGSSFFSDYDSANARITCGALTLEASTGSSGSAASGVIIEAL